MRIFGMFRGMKTRPVLLWLIGAGLSGALMSGEASAVYFITGNVLLDRCTASQTGNGLTDLAFCAGYVTDIADTLDRTTITVSPDSGGHWQIRACVPTGVSISQLMDVVVRYLRASPDVRHFNGSILATKAISEAFPCRS